MKVLEKKNILVVGDVMLDKYVYGDVERISPEAPIPILKKTSQESVPGGAANVACNIASLGSNVYLIGAIGDDKNGQELYQMMSKQNSIQLLLHKCADLTTTKTRYMSNGQQMLRVDEDSNVMSTAFLYYVKHDLTNIIDSIDLIVLSDYGKGCLHGDVCKFIIDFAKDHKIKIIVDPKGKSFVKYSGTYLVKPNLREFCEVANINIKTSSSDFEQRLSTSAHAMLSELRIEAIAVTLGDAGVFFMKANENTGIIFPAFKVDVADVSGAGDTFIAVLSICIANDLESNKALRFANRAASLSVMKHKTASITEEELLEAVEEDELRSRIKTVDFSQLESIRSRCSLQHKVIGFTNGCFDCCHLGHIHSLKDTKKLCDVLVVGVNSDSWIRSHKGPKRPIQDEKTRLNVIAEFECVDYAVLFSDETALEVIKELKPDIIAKQGYAISEWPEAQYVQSYGGKAIQLDKLDGYSTTSILQKVIDSR